MDNKKLGQLADLMKRKDLSELEIDGERVRMVRAVAVQQQVLAAPLVVEESSQSAKEASPQEADKPAGTPVDSPMVGSFYAAPSPNAEPFVKPGQKVKRGDVLCIIEAMKMMNYVKCQKAGTVGTIMVEDSQPVQYGQVLMYIV